jgi:hypothetical protein
MDFQVEQSHSSSTAQITFTDPAAMFRQIHDYGKRRLRNYLWPLFSLNTTICVSVILPDAGIQVTTTSPTAGF